MSEQEFQPKIVAFLCNWCTYVAADAAGVSRFTQKPNVRAIRVNCSGMVDPSYIVKAFTSGADEDVPSARVFSKWLLRYLREPQNPTFLGSEAASWIKPRVAGETGQVPQYFQIPKAGYGGGDFAFFQTAPRR